MPWLGEGLAAQFVAVAAAARGGGSSSVAGPGACRSAVAAVEDALDCSDGLQWMLARSQTQSSEPSSPSPSASLFRASSSTRSAVKNSSQDSCDYAVYVH